MKGQMAVTMILLMVFIVSFAIIMARGPFLHGAKTGVWP